MRNSSADTSEANNTIGAFFRHDRVPSFLQDDVDAITEREADRRQEQAHGAREAEMRMMVKSIGHPQCERMHPPEGTRQPQDSAKFLACEAARMIGPGNFKYMV